MILSLNKMTSSPKRKRREKKKISSPKRKKVSRKRISRKRSKGSKKRASPPWEPGRLRKKQFRVPKNNLKRIKSIFLVKTPSRLERSYISKRVKSRKASREYQKARVNTPIARAPTKAPDTPQRNKRMIATTNKLFFSPIKESVKEYVPSSAETIRVLTPKRV